MLGEASLSQRGKKIKLKHRPRENKGSPSALPSRPGVWGRKEGTLTGTFHGGGGRRAPCLWGLGACGKRPGSWGERKSGFTEAIKKKHGRFQSGDLGLKKHDYDSERSLWRLHGERGAVGSPGGRVRGWGRPGTVAADVAGEAASSKAGARGEWEFPEPSRRP